ncbi:MAG: hypothetical protein KF729_34305 [Sandaracinaceae bacterium]|nr:hypothetical protein [Sandaracinaceae bacterium]
MNRPIERCYWVVPGRLLAGEYPRNEEEASSREKVGAFLRAGVAAFIDLTQERELAPYATWIGEAAHHRFPIRDGSIPTSVDAVMTTLDTIDGYVERDQLVYVHCWGGVGRTGSPETEAQARYVSRWEAGR